MWMTAIGWAVSLLRLLLGAKTEPTVADKAAEAANAETQLSQREADNAVTNEAATARAAADVAVVRWVTASGPAVQPALNDELAKQFPDQFRD